MLYCRVTVKRQRILTSWRNCTIWQHKGKERLHHWTPLWLWEESKSPFLSLGLQLSSQRTHLQYSSQCIGPTDSCRYGGPLLKHCMLFPLPVPYPIIFSWNTSTTGNKKTPQEQSVPSHENLAQTSSKRLRVMRAIKVLCQNKREEIVLVLRICRGELVWKRRRF